MFLFVVVVAGGGSVVSVVVVVVQIFKFYSQSYDSVTQCTILSLVVTCKFMVFYQPRCFSMHHL
jgi:hypothetical protein